MTTRPLKPLFALLAALGASTCLALAVPTHAVAEPAKPAARAAVEINPDIEALEKNLENRIIESLRTYLGADPTGHGAKVIARVHVKELVRGPASIDRADKGIDLLYAPVPVVRTADPAASPRKTVLVKAVEAEVQVGGELDDATLTGARELVESALKGYNATVSLTKLPLPSLRAPAAVSASMPDSGAPSGPAPHYPLLAIVFAALLLSAAILVTAYTLRASAETMAQGLSRAFEGGLGSVAINSGLSAPTVVPQDETAASPPLPAEPFLSPAVPSPALNPPVSPADLEHYQRNLKLVKDALAQTPMLLVRTLTDGPEDLAGLRWLLPALTDVEQQALKTYLGPSGLNRLTSSASAEPRAYQIPWLQDFVERLLLRKINERSLVEKAVDPAKAARLALADPTQLIAAARRLGSPSAWRLLTEFLPKPRLNSLIGSLAATDWGPLFRAGEMDAAELAAAADQILSFLEDSPRQSREAQERTRYYQRTLLEPMLRTLAKKDLSEENAFLSELRLQAPELLPLIQERFWTASELARVPDDVLIPRLAELRIEQRVSLLLALPLLQAERLLNLMPGGNARSIVDDQWRQAQRRGDAAEQRAGTSLARLLLEQLRLRCLAGAFQLLPERPQPGEATVADSVTRAA